MENIIKRVERIEDKFDDLKKQISKMDEIIKFNEELKKINKEYKDQNDELCVRDLQELWRDKEYIEDRSQLNEEICNYIRIYLKDATHNKIFFNPNIWGTLKLVEKQDSIMREYKINSVIGVNTTGII